MRFFAILLGALSAVSAYAVELERVSFQDFQGLMRNVSVPAAAPSKPAAKELVYEKDGTLIQTSQLFSRLSRARLVYIGEQHDQAAHHGVQLKVLQALHARKHDLVVGMEMISQDLQPSLDQYLSGAMSDADFEKFWKKAWGFPLPLYKPIFDYCKSQGIHVVGLNAPIAVIRQIAKGGIASLTPDQRRWLPTAVAQTSDAKYLAYLEKSLEGHGPMTPDQKAHMLEAMAAWNETMGAKAAELGASHPVLVIAGSGHVVYGKGIVESSARRNTLRQQVVLPYPLDGEQTPLADLLKALRDPKTGDAELADHFWLLPND